MARHRGGRVMNAHKFLTIFKRHYKKTGVYVPLEIVRWSIQRPNSYPSEFGEDKVLKNLFLYRYGTYLDIGCHHPIRESNTYWLYKKLGWSGINIDLSEASIKLFDHFRPNDINIQAPVSHKSEEITCYIFADLHCMNTIDEPFAMSVAQKTGLAYKKIKMKTVLVDELIRAHGVQKIDFLNVDIEGMDKHVLESFPFGRIQPKVIAFENHADPFTANVKFLEKVGYRLVSLCGPTYIFASIDQLVESVWPFRIKQ